MKNEFHYCLSMSWLKTMNLRAFVLISVIFLFGSTCPKILGLHNDYGMITGGEAKATAGRESQASQEEEIHIERDKDHIVITNQMTLLQVEDILGIETRCIADELSLPPEVPINMPLELLRKIYPFTLQEFKEVLEKLIDQQDRLHKEKKEGSKTELGGMKQTIDPVSPRESRHYSGRHRLIRGRMASIPSGILITGKTTLYDLEEMTGIPARKIADALGIPSENPLNDHLGFLRKKYRFSIHTVRETMAVLIREKKKK